MVLEEKMIANGEPEDEEEEGEEEEEEEEEEDMVDPLDMVRQKCEGAEHCAHSRERLEECETRVGSRSSTREDCTEELFDFLHARDHCAILKELSHLSPFIFALERTVKLDSRVAHKLFHTAK